MANIDKLKKNLSKHLFDDESISATVEGSFETEFLNSKTYKTGILSLTNKRILFYAKKLFGEMLESFPLESISSLETSKGLTGRKISFFASGNRVKLKWIQRGEIDLFVRQSQMMIGKKPTSGIEEKPSLDQIEKLADLLKQGAITQADYDSKKQDILSRI